MNAKKDWEEKTEEEKNPTDRPRDGEVHIWKWKWLQTFWKQMDKHTQKVDI